MMMMNVIILALALLQLTTTSAAKRHDKKKSALTSYDSTTVFPTIDLTNIDTMGQGFNLNGAHFDSVTYQPRKLYTPAGDFNGDGFSDVITVGISNVTQGTCVRTSYLVFGHTRAPAFNDVDINSLTFTSDGVGFKITKTTSCNDGFGQGLQCLPTSGGGDVNGDGYSDLLVGSYLDTALGRTQAGIVYVIYGFLNATVPYVDVNLDLGIAPGSGFMIYGASPYFWLGYVVSSLGDVNGDQIDDIVIVSSYMVQGRSGGKAATKVDATGTRYIVFGRTSLATNIDLAYSNFTSGRYGVKIFPPKTSTFQSGDMNAISIGDINSDNINDILIGSSSGTFFAIFGKVGFYADVNLTMAGFTNLKKGFKINGLTTGGSASCGDFNGDGRSDILIGAYFDPVYPNSTGTSYVIFGQNSAYHFPDIDLRNPNFTSTPFGMEISGIDPQTVGGAGDYNGDGHIDILIGGRTEDNVKSTALVFGQSDLSSMTMINVTESTFNTGIDQQGFHITGSVYNSVSCAGDMDSDGFHEIQVDVSVVFGRPNSPTSSPTIDPSIDPSSDPSFDPTFDPSVKTSFTPTILTSISPSISPSYSPTTMPSKIPSVIPSSIPTSSPSSVKSSGPSVFPSILRSSTPSSSTTKSPTKRPSTKPSVVPTIAPTLSSSSVPSIVRSTSPSVTPSLLSTTVSSAYPTITTSFSPTRNPSKTPGPTKKPSSKPSTIPTSIISNPPQLTPTTMPTMDPSVRPSIDPTIDPSVSLSVDPTSTPTTFKPSSSPSSKLTKKPSVKPTLRSS